MTITGKTKLAAVIGWPIGHSLSPALHGHWCKAQNIDGVVIPLAVRPENFETVVRTLPLMGFSGAWVTIPHKEQALRLADSVDPVGEKIGAVNTLVFEKDNTIRARNTDAFGFVENFKSQLPAVKLRDAHGLILGAGGAASAAVAGLIELGCSRITISNRTSSRAADLAAHWRTQTSVPVETVDWADRDRALSDTDILVNATSLGMTGQPDLEIDLNQLPKTAAVADIVYRPLKTTLLNSAEKRGNPIATGLGMLVHQGRPGFEAMFGAAPADFEGAEKALMTQLGQDP